MYSLFFVEHLLYCGVRSGSVKKILDPDKNKRTLSAALWLYQYKKFVHKTFKCSTLSQSSNKNVLKPVENASSFTNLVDCFSFFISYWSLAQIPRQMMAILSVPKNINLIY